MVKQVQFTVHFLQILCNTDRMTEAALRPTVLFVDDETDLCEVIKDGLEKQGFEVCIAYSAKEAREQMRQPKKIDIIVSDIRMPDESGLDLLKTIRGAKNDVPFLLMSGHMEIDNQTAQKLGADGAFAKPFKLAGLAEKIRTVLQNKALFAAGPKKKT